jgi:hypothetical protein
MKTLKLLAFGSVLLGASQITHGSVLLGFNSFAPDTVDANGTDVDYTPDEAKTGWSGSITSDLAINGGSTDNYYGKDWDQPGIGHLIYGAPPTSNNGYVDNGNITLFVGTAGTAGSIDALLFDAVSTGAATTFKVDWKFWTDSSMTTEVAGGSGTSGTLSLAAGTTAKADSNYEDFAVNLGSFFLPVGGYFEITWDRLTGQSSFKLDNIALVPEPGSMLGLGCLVGFGTLLRSRRRTGPAVIA